jgi:hypothetical protein
VLATTLLTPPLLRRRLLRVRAAQHPAGAGPQGRHATGDAGSGAGRGEGRPGAGRGSP